MQLSRSKRARFPCFVPGGARQVLCDTLDVRMAKVTTRFAFVSCICRSSTGTQMPLYILWFHSRTAKPCAWFISAPGLMMGAAEPCLALVCQCLFRSFRSLLLARLVSR